MQNPLKINVEKEYEMLMPKMPALIEDNQYTRTWRGIAERIPKPDVILSVSAHWFT
jgi:aromatic ring-opening dioxygenase catalytic subunit (LigB family)